MPCRYALAALVLMLAASARATLLVYEPFDYPVGTLAGQNATGHNLTGTFASGSVVPATLELRAETPSLGYGALRGAPSFAGQRLGQNLGTTAASAVAALASPVSIAPDGALFFSALFLFDDSTNGNRFARIDLLNQQNGDVLSFGESVVGVMAVAIGAQTAAAGANGVSAGADRSFTNGQVLFLFGRYQNGAAAQGDRLDLVGYETNAVTQIPGSFDPSDPAAQFRFSLTGVDIDMTRIDAVRFEIRGSANNFIDELRVGTTYADVVPEPAAAPLLLLGLAGFALRARFSRDAGARTPRG
ncbi:MAG TPA: PEP-CTERM sorting domain-containing protein [Myxococcota bacterium]|nr:PEP-CTERM sorting domain-containing protein [Myxococcota bacterium]